MFKDQIETLYQLNKNDMNSIIIIESMLHSCNNHIYSVATASSKTTKEKDEPSTAITYAKCVPYLIAVNDIAKKNNMPELFPNVEKMSQQEITHKYIKPIMWEYVQNRKK